MSRWATVGFAVLAALLGAVIAVVAARNMMPAYRSVRHDGTTLAVVALVSNPIQVVALMLASRRSGTNVLAYLGLDIPRWRDIAIAMADLAIFIVLVDTLMLALGRDMVSPWMLEIRRSAQADGSLIWLWLAVVVATPIGEELLFRGFMLRGFVHAPRDATPSIVVTSLIWSLLHIQYDWFDIAGIFVFGSRMGALAYWLGHAHDLPSYGSQSGKLERDGVHVGLGPIPDQHQPLFEEGQWQLSPPQI